LEKEPVRIEQEEVRDRKPLTRFLAVLHCLVAHADLPRIKSSSTDLTSGILHQDQKKVKNNQKSALDHVE
jgi:hypothetical protein